MSTPSFSAALVAGGHSTRMGRDKALLCLPDSKLALWQRQWHVLRGLKPEEIFWAGHPRPGLPEAFRLVPDSRPDAGPLAGVDACLHLCRSDLLLVLAIDLPQMTTVFLQDLLAKCTKVSGAVGRRGDFFEPLAAVYPGNLQPLSSAHLPLADMQCRISSAKASSPA